MNNLMQHSNPHAQMLTLYLIGLLHPCKAGVAGKLNAAPGLLSVLAPFGLASLWLLAGA